MRINHRRCVFNIHPAARPDALQRTVRHKQKLVPLKTDQFAGNNFFMRSMNIAAVADGQGRTNAADFDKQPLHRRNPTVISARLQLVDFINNIFQTQ